MKTIFSAIVLVLLFSIPALATDIELPHIVVYGTSVLEITPDEMFWTLNVTNKASSVETVAKQHSEIVKSVIIFLGKASIDIDDIQTSRMQFGENWGYKNNSRVREGYFASTQVSFTLTAFDKYKKLWSGLANIKNVSIENVSYDHSQRIEFHSKTRGKALLAAKEKAITMANALNASIAEPLLIEEDLSFDKIPMNQNILIVNEASSRDEPHSLGGSFALGKIPIRARVKVAYRLINQ
ncbi:SIMPL domain-containing protein [Desulfobulbus rhabdoformis]|uniref:SIMPL domain-containing protein n=1 Tax=Desulfobulbus rhabdoformis TaxID=34032 RepID=UPI0019664F5B|nr:SIMPL domain-containing protein [Desulfobulbus rhabdoformis]MBM9616949.1 SIMPL domain-containing protein [Desulfobulbus rhabdoformis]